jgi:hypothetical protein
VSAQFLESWQALSRRINGLVKAGQLCRPNDSYGTFQRLREQALKILTELDSFKGSFGHSLPPSALSAIEHCVRTDVDISVGKLLRDIAGTRQAEDEKIWSALVMLAAFETEVTFILSDVQAAIRARSERAFSHLQRLIVVDSRTREQWNNALNGGGEIACERLGAVHLLWHGIWAFKVNAKGGRTDLVYPEPIDEIPDDQHFADGLVLTEWKVATTDKKAHEKFREARVQAKLYATGVLAGNELRAFRYMVVVTPDHVTVPDDIKDGAVVYRHINVAVCAKPPSQHSRGRSRSS